MWSGCGSNPDQTRVKPGSNPDQTRIKPGSNPDQTRIKPGSNPHQTQVKPGSNPGQTRIKPGSNPGQTRIKPGSNPDQTWIKPKKKYKMQNKNFFLASCPPQKRVPQNKITKFFFAFWMLFSAPLLVAGCVASCSSPPAIPNEGAGAGAGAGADARHVQVLECSSALKTVVDSVADTRLGMRSMVQLLHMQVYAVWQSCLLPQKLSSRKGECSPGPCPKACLQGRQFFRGEECSVHSWQRG